jgi:hypothetical protein
MLFQSRQRCRQLQRHGKPTSQHAVIFTLRNGFPQARTFDIENFQRTPESYSRYWRLAFGLFDHLIIFPVLSELGADRP